MTTEQNINSYLYYINIYKDFSLSASDRAILALLASLDIKDDQALSKIKSVTNDRLNPVVEAPHILAYCRTIAGTPKAWTKNNWAQKLRHWWTNTKRAEGMETASKNPQYKAAAADIAGIMNTEPDPVIDTMEDIQGSKYSQNALIHILSQGKKELIEYHQDHDKDDLKGRADAFCKHIRYDASSDHWHRAAILAYDNGRIPSDLLLWIRSDYVILGGFLMIISSADPDCIDTANQFRIAAGLPPKGPTIDPDKKEKPIEVDQEDPRPVESTEGLYSITCRLPGSFFTVLATVLKEEGDRLHIETPMPIQNKTRHIIDRAIATKIAQKENTSSGGIGPLIDQQISNLQTFK